MQINSAFGQVDALSWFVTAYAQLADWKATVDRLTSFRTILRPRAGLKSDRYRNCDARQQHLQDERRQHRSSQRQMLAPFSVEIEPGESVLVAGASGSGRARSFARCRDLAVRTRQGAAPRDAKNLFLPPNLI
jgi:putative ATP-binding cassette transporter